MKVAARIVPSGPAALAIIGLAAFAVFIAWCFAGYLTAAALVSLLSGLSFCG
ncbi:hypothetical protein [Paraburkholderia kururiensis]|uniref:hypothetical protein n=1 Tax=Paraburkholderia kururiensis TaxID=984307 RepID=UPI00144AE26C|nr:hypothetical protein [Paraburkholderia kururiensis]